MIVDQETRVETIEAELAQAKTHLADLRQIRKRGAGSVKSVDGNSRFSFLLIKQVDKDVESELERILKRYTKF